MKKIYLIIIICVLAIGILGAKFIINDKNNNHYIQLKICNKTSVTINNLKVTYKNIKKDIDVPTINPNEKIHMNITPDKNFSEGSLEIKYFDKNKVEHKETIIGYFEKINNTIVPKVNATIDIVSIDDKGIYKFTVNNLRKRRELGNRKQEIGKRTRTTVNC